MEGLYGLLLIICFLMFLLGVINPKWVLMWEKEKTRKKVGIYFGIPFFVFFLLFTFSLPNDEQENKTATIENINAINTENNEYSEKAVFSSDMTEDEFFSLLKKDDLYNECIEISDRVSKYKRNKKWVIGTAEYLLEKCDKFDYGRIGGGFKNIQGINFHDETHNFYEGAFNRIKGALIRKIYSTILQKNLYKFSIFLPINKDSLLDLLAQNHFSYIEDFEVVAGCGDYIIHKIYSQTEDSCDPEFWVGWDKISGKLVYIYIPFSYPEFEFSGRVNKDEDYETFINAFMQPYDYSMQVIEMFADDDLRNYLYKQIESFKNYDRLKFEESREEIGKIFFSQTLTFNKYTIYISGFSVSIGTILMAIYTTEAANILELEDELRSKYLMEREMSLK